MRISDWSSDVCSSDLGRAAAEVILAQDEGFALVPGVAAADRQAEPVGEIEGRIAEYGKGRRIDIGLGKGGQSRESVEDAHVEQSVGASVEIIEAAQIGRASCRDRVCQYGYIPVVAVSINKNV